MTPDEVEFIDVIEIECSALDPVGYARDLEDVAYILENMMGDKSDWGYLVDDFRITFKVVKMSKRKFEALEPFEEIL